MGGDRLLDTFLCLADAHGSFQETICHCDDARLTSAVRLQRKAGKELARLAAAARDGARPSRLGLGRNSTEVEVTGLLSESAAPSPSPEKI